MTSSNDIMFLGFTQILNFDSRKTTFFQSQRPVYNADHFSDLQVIKLIKWPHWLIYVRLSHLQLKKLSFSLIFTTASMISLLPSQFNISLPLPTFLSPLPNVHYIYLSISLSLYLSLTQSHGLSLPFSPFLFTHDHSSSFSLLLPFPFHNLTPIMIWNANNFIFFMYSIVLYLNNKHKNRSILLYHESILNKSVLVQQNGDMRVPMISE